MASFSVCPRPDSAVYVPFSSACRLRCVGASNDPSTWSSACVDWIWAGGIVPPSGSLRPEWLPGDMAMYASPSRVFWRRMARVSAGSGANRGWMSIVTSEFTPRARTATTLPTLTPEMRTSALGTSSPVS